jgi:hypothetical protein
MGEDTITYGVVDVAENQINCPKRTKKHIVQERNGTP